jgi:hypothetical protein
LVVEAPVIEIEVASIKWPEHVVKPFEREAGLTSLVSSVTSETSVSSVYSVQFTKEELIDRCIAAEQHQTDAYLFKLARGVLALIEANKIEEGEIIAIFDEWHSRSRQAGVLRPELSRDDYLVQFMSKRNYANVPLDSPGTLERAWNAAKTSQVPKIATHYFQTKEMRLSVSLLRELGRIADPFPFYLSVRKLAGLLGHNNHSTAAVWLSAFRSLKIIKEVEKGAGDRASRYLYLHPLYD